ncbi:MAG: PKD domain-containing protein [Phycisphaerae bacterium]
MNQGQPSKTSFTLLLITAILGSSLMAGCDLLGGRLSPAPFGQITAVQLFDEPSFTVAFSVESAVNFPAAIARVNWVFGDGGGFVEGPADRATTTHQYAAPGDYEITAFLFDTEGFVDQIKTTIRVDADGTLPIPDPDTTPADLPEDISGPMPIDGAEDVPVDSMLIWLGGVHATSHNVYLGTVKRDVEIADENTPITFLGNQEETFLVPDLLLPDTQYFWRVDEVNDLGVTTGAVMRFTTAAAPLRNKDFIPPDGVTTLPVAGILEWTPGVGATSHDVYFAKNESAVTAATNESEGTFMGNQTATSFDPEDTSATVEGELQPSTMYFWRIDGVGLGGTTKGAVLHFTTAALPPRVTDSIPTDEALNVEASQLLSWSASPDIENFDLYLGTDHAAVAGATRGSPEFLDNTSNTFFDPGSLIGGKDYFWRIDTIGPGGITRGDVFTFTTTAPPLRTAGLVPADGDTNVAIEIILGWDPDLTGNTLSYEIFLSTNENDVLTAVPAARIAIPIATGTAPETFDPIDLNPDTNYFWRIDAVGAGGTTTGTISRFRTAALPVISDSPTPAVGEMGIALDTMLEWMPDVVAPGYDVYLGTDQSVVQNADTTSAVFKMEVTGTTFTPALELDGNTTYYWRIDARSPGGVVKGNTWNFTTAPARPDGPSPEHIATGVDVNINLEWMTASGADSFDVFLGTNRLAVLSATNTMVGIFRDNVTGTLFDPDTLAPMTTYYWRIDSVGATGTTPGELWEFTTGAAQATNPQPADGMTGVILTPMLNWTPDTANATAHDIYFGMNQTTVANADHTSPVFQGAFDVATGPPPFNPGNLQGMTTYYWRIDSVTTDGTTKGEVWQFRTGPGKAASPTPAHFDTDVSINTTLGWTTGSGALTHEVYLGTNEAMVGSASILSVPPGVTLFTTIGTILDPGVLIADTTYFWRVDTVAPDGTTRTQGDIWRFTTLAVPLQANLPIPFNGAADVAAAGATLTWAAADRATSYDIYFGTDMANPTFQGNQAQRSYSPGTLAAATTYYWRIDAVNESGITTGTLWSFTTAP